MKKSYTIAGIGACLGDRPGCEILAETILSGGAVADTESAGAAELAVREALRYTAHRDLPVLTDTQTTAVGEQTLCRDLGDMLARAPQQALLLSHRANGWIAIALTQERSGFARVTLCDDGASPADGDLLPLLLAALEIRYALHLDDRDTPYRFWDAQGERRRELDCGGMRCTLTEPELPIKRVYEAKKYLLPVVFTTVGEAVQKLEALKAAPSLSAAMAELLPTLAKRNEQTNTIVLLAADREALCADIDDLLRQADRLTERGFSWRSKSGSRYVCRTTAHPKIVFMNPPAGMFNARAFYTFFLNLYGAMDEISRFETDRLFTGDKQLFLSEYLFDIVVNYCVTTLLDSIGIRPQIMSGASMGELSNILYHLRYADGTVSDTVDVLPYIDAALKVIAREDDAPLHEHLGRTTDGYTKFYVKGDAAAFRAAAAAHDDIFVMIVGSTEDVILTGARASLRRFVQDNGLVASELSSSNYAHTPVVAPLAEDIRRGMLSSGVRLHDPGYTMFSTHLCKPLDDTPEMLADNVAALLTQTVDYAAAVDAMYDNGGRVFIDLSTTQMCGTWASATLKHRADAVVASLYAGSEASESLLELCASLLVCHVPFAHERLLSKLAFRDDAPAQAIPESKEETPMPETTYTAPHAAGTPMPGAEFAQVLQQRMIHNERAFKLFMDAQSKLYEQMLSTPAAPAAEAAVRFPQASAQYLYDRQQVITMTDTSMSAVLGERYREVDQYPVRARMPLPPFLFVSRIISIDAEFGVFRPSSIVAEYDLDEDCVFRVGDTYICPLVASEASHIAIFLIAYMGLDAVSQGTLSYRAIDSYMTAHSERPFRVGDTLRTVLKINRFVKNGSTTLLFFTFESYNGDELIAVTEATGGFFTKADLASNKGIIKPKKQLPKKTEPREFIHFRDSNTSTYDREAMEAFFRGDYLTCFGVAPKPTHKEIYRVPLDMQMIDRVTCIDYNGGMYGRGIICGEKQITPDLWPFRAHFKNDPVFPAIIVSDGITQLGMFLFAHAGLLQKFDNANFTMIKDNCVKSRFRGQVRHGYSTLRYEVHVKEVVETDTYINAYFDAEIFNDELQIMQIDSYVLKISGEAI